MITINSFVKRIHSAFKETGNGLEHFAASRTDSAKLHQGSQSLDDDFYQAYSESFGNPAVNSPMSGERIPSDISSKERVAQLSRAMHRDAASISEGVARTLDSVGMMETIVTREAESIERCVSENEKRLSAVLDELVRQGDALVSISQQSHWAFSGASRDIQSAAASLNVSVQSVCNDIAGSTALRAEGIERSIQEGSLALKGSIEAQSKELSASLATKIEEFNATLDYLEALEERFSLISSDTNRMLDQQGMRISETLSDGILDFNQRLCKTVSEAGEKIDLHCARVEAALADRFSILEERLTRFETRLREQPDMAPPRPELRRSSIGSSVASEGNWQFGNRNDGNLQDIGVRDLVDALYADIAKRFNEHEEKLRLSLQRSGEDVAERLAQSFAQINEQLTATATDAVVALATHGEILTGHLSDTIARSRVQSFGDVAGEAVATAVDEHVRLLSAIAHHSGSSRDELSEDAARLVARANRRVEGAQDPDFDSPYPHTAFVAHEAESHVFSDSLSSDLEVFSRPDRMQ
jgi:hypothetical protein